MSKNPKKPQTNDVVLGGQSSPTSLSQCPICKTEYTKGKVNRCSFCNWDLTPCPETFVKKYNAQLAWTREMWINFQAQEKQFHASQSQLEEVKQDKARFEGEVLHRLEKLEQAQDRSEPVIWTGVTHDSSNFDELEKQWTKIKAQLKKAQQEQQELKLDVSQLSSQVAELKAEQQKKIFDAPSLISDAGIDYSRLRNFLAAGEWEKANFETVGIINTMLYRISQEPTDYTRLAEIREDFINHIHTNYSQWMVGCTIEYDEQSGESNNFYNVFQKLSSKEMHLIDNLWVRYSYGRFGLSVQERLYELLGRDIVALAKAVNWGRWHKDKDDKKERYISSDKDYSINAPVGHLPIIFISFWRDDYLIRYLPSFLEKISACSLDSGGANSQIFQYLEE